MRGAPYVIKTAGEFDVKGVAIYGVESKHGGEKEKNTVNVMYRYEIDNISIAHLGDLGEALSDKQLELLAGVDILLIPVGGKYTLDAKKAVECFIDDAVYIEPPDKQFFQGKNQLYQYFGGYAGGDFEFVGHGYTRI